MIALLLFGAKRVPEIGRSLGHGMREFKDSVSGSDDHETHISQAERLPELGHSLGEGVREFKDSITDSGDHHKHTQQAALPPTNETAATHTTTRERRPLGRRNSEGSLRPSKPQHLGDNTLAWASVLSLRCPGRPPRRRIRVTCRADPLARLISAGVPAVSGWPLGS